MTDNNLKPRIGFKRIKDPINDGYVYVPVAVKDSEKDLILFLVRALGKITVPDAEKTKEYKTIYAVLVGSIL